MHTAAYIAETIDGKIDGDPNLTVQGVCDLKDSRPKHISYVVPGRYEKSFNHSQADVVLVAHSFSLERGTKTLIRVDNPVVSFIDVVHLFHPVKQPIAEIHCTAVIAENVQMGENVQIAPHAVIEKNVIIGDKVRIGAGVFIGHDCVIGNESLINSNVSIYHGIEIGSNCIIDSGSVLGSDGFGLVTEMGKHHKIPHIGGVKVKDNVWIGSNCCIDRGTLGNTVIGAGAKLDNLVHIAHNVQIGKDCLVAGQVGIAGSTIVEDNVTIAGQVGIVGHLIIGKDSTIASKSAVFHSLKPGSFVSGIPARLHKNRLRQDVIINQLPELLSRIRKLEQISALTEET